MKDEKTLELCCIVMCSQLTVQHLIVKHLSRGCVLSLSHVRLFATPWTIACQAPLSVEFSRQEYWSGLPFPSPVGFPDPGIKPAPPALAGWFLTTVSPGKPVKATASIFLIPFLLLQRHTHAQFFTLKTHYIHYILSFISKCKLKKIINYFTWLCWVLAVACGI